MAKKKKTQLKPVARGFATTSVPKKVPLSELASDADYQDGDVDAPLRDEQGTNETVAPEGSEAEQLLQSLVDKLQEKTEREITRYFIDIPNFALIYDNSGTRTIKVCFDVVSCDGFLYTRTYTGNRGGSTVFKVASSFSVRHSAYGPHCLSGDSIEHSRRCGHSKLYDEHAHGSISQVKRSFSNTKTRQ